MRPLLIALTAFVVILTAGCGGGSRPQATASNNLISLPHTFVGTFSSSDALYGSQTGTLNLDATSNGTLAGQFDDTTQGQDGTVSGTLQPDGETTFTSTYSGVVYTFSGQLTYVPASGSTPDSLSGTLEISAPEQSFNKTTAVYAEVGSVQVQLTTAVQ